MIGSIGQKLWVVSQFLKKKSEEVKRKITRPRPGHADLNGGIKYGHRDLRNVLERSSARETTVRVAAGAVAKKLLSLLGIEVASHVLEIGGVKANPAPYNSIKNYNKSQKHHLFAVLIKK